MGNYDVRLDTRFNEVIDACAGREETWISGEIVEAYQALHYRGYAHSVETWKDDRLVGGLYGVSIGGAFFGESMFSRESNASKISLVRLVERLRSRGYMLLDAQFMTPHLKQFGAIQIPREEYLRRLAAAIRVETSFLD